MGDAEIGSDEDYYVAFLEVRVGVGRGIEAEGLLVSGDGGGHALAGVGIAVEKAHPEFEKAAEEGHFLERNLSGGEEGDGFVAVLFLDGFESAGESFQSGFPVGRDEFSFGVAEQWGGGTVGGVERIESLPAFRAGHAEVHREAGLGVRLIAFPSSSRWIFELAAGGAVAADGGRG